MLLTGSAIFYCSPIACGDVRQNMYSNWHIRARTYVTFACCCFRITRKLAECIFERICFGCRAAFSSAQCILLLSKPPSVLDSTMILPPRHFIAMSCMRTWLNKNMFCIAQNNIYKMCARLYATSLTMGSEHLSEREREMCEQIAPDRNGTEVGKTHERRTNNRDLR